MRELGSILSLVAIIVAVIALVRYWPASHSDITPDDVVEFSKNSASLAGDRSKTGLQKDREAADLWREFAGKRVRWAGQVYDVRSVGYIGEIEVVVTFPIREIEAVITFPPKRKYDFLMVFLEYPSEARGKLAKYQVKQEIWFYGTIPKDGRGELQKAAESAIHLPGRIAPK